MEWRYFLLFLAMIAFQTGCRSLSPNSGDSSIDKLATNPPTDGAEVDVKPTVLSDPTRMAIIWNENVLQSDAAPAVKGFTGRIYFYNQKGEIVEAQGQLNVYGYDDSGPVKKRVPDLHFIVEPDKFAEHYSKSDLGHSYSVWIPWEQYGGHRKSITLISVFKTNGKKIIQGGADKLMLSGKMRKSDALQRTIVEHRSPIQHPQQFANAANSAKTQNPSNSIPIPENIAEQWRLVNELQHYSQRRHLIPPNPVTMKLLDQAEEQQDGQAYNQVSVSRNRLKCIWRIHR